MLGTASVPAQNADLQWTFCANQDYSAECGANNGNVLGQRLLPLNETASYGFDGYSRVTSAAAGV